MKKLILCLIFALFGISGFAQQYYYKVVQVYDNNLVPLSNNNPKYFVHKNNYVTVSYLNNYIIARYHQGSYLQLPYAYKDPATGNHFYAQQFMGQPVFTDMFGNYYYIQFENGSNRILIANDGVMDECIPVSEEEYFNYINVMNSMNSYSAPSVNNNISSYPNNNTTINSNNNYNNSNNINSEQKTGTWVNKKCTACNGTGKSIAKTYAPHYGGTRTTSYCSICNGYDYAHSHKDCGVCKGKGYIQDYEY